MVFARGKSRGILGVKNMFESSKTRVYEGKSGTTCWSATTGGVKVRRGKSRVVVRDKSVHAGKR